MFLLMVRTEKRNSQIKNNIFDHKDSAGHKAAVEIDNESKKGKLEAVCIK